MKILASFFYTLWFLIHCISAQLPEEKPLWPSGIKDNPISYKEEKVRNEVVLNSSPSRQNRVYSCISTPTYTLHKPANPNGVAIVICPGGGFRDVWIDREGNDFALFLAKHNITSLVLKYRTFNTSEGISIKWPEYASHVYADVKQAIYLLRSQAKELGLDENKIGIGGYSAGGSLSINVLLEIMESNLPSYASFNNVKTDANFACLIYPAIMKEFSDAVKAKTTIPPVFMINGGEDKVTPANRLVDFYNSLTKNNTSVEMHIYAKGEHGFDSGIDRGESISTWQDSFIAWLKDMKFMK